MPLPGWRQDSAAPALKLVWVIAVQAMQDKPAGLGSTEETDGAICLACRHD